MDEATFEELMKIQSLTASSLANESEMDDTIKVLSIIREVVPTTGGLIQVESVLVECRAQGYPDSKVLRILEKLKEDKLISESKRGYVRLE